MSGLRRICKALGGMTVTGNNGKTIHYVWDYAADEPVDKKDMPTGSERHKRSEQARFAAMPVTPQSGDGHEVLTVSAGSPKPPAWVTDGER